ncbi:MAG TPA: heme-copper oxidase subunit III [Acidobacteriaceae bacterium]|nr:heme-copper oxidase subunit III [Acidobacteriaceae bacterium]
MGTVPLEHIENEAEWHLPSRGRVAMVSLIVAETAVFSIFVVAYLFYLGRDVYGPTPHEVLEVPIFNTVCLLSSSFFIWLAERSIEHGRMGAFKLWWAITFVLGLIFIVGTGIEWHHLITVDHLTVSTNLFGTTFYSLVGLHATHVIIGLLMLLIVLLFALTGKLNPTHAERVQVLGLYWHFVDAVWVVVFTVVYIVGR